MRRPEIGGGVAEEWLLICYQSDGKKTKNFFKKKPESFKMSTESYQEKAFLIKRLDFDPAQIAAALGSVAEKFSKKDLGNLVLKEGEEVWGIFLYNQRTHVCCDLTLFPNRKTVYLYTRVPMEALEVSTKRKRGKVEIISHLGEPTTEMAVDHGFFGLDQITEVCFYPFSQQVEFISRRQDSISVLKVGPDCRHSMTIYSPEVFK